MAEIRLGSIGQIALNVSDVEQAVEFYGGKLGMTQIFAAPDLAFFANGETRLMLSSVESENGSGNRGSVVYYSVDDINVAHEELASAGIDFHSDPELIHSAGDYELWMAFFKDPDGNQLAIMYERGELN